MNKTLRIALCGEEVTTPLEDQIESTDKVDTGEGQTITMSGPLAEIYTKALHVVFAKKNMAQQEVTMESQANDAIMAFAVAKSIAMMDEDEPTLKDMQANMSNTIYGDDSSAFVIEASKLHPDVIVAASKIVVKNSNNDRAFLVVQLDGLNNPTILDHQYVMIPKFDNSITGQNVGISKEVGLEQYCESLGMELVYGLEGLLKAMQTPKRVKQ